MQSSITQAASLAPIRPDILLRSATGGDRSFLGAGGGAASLSADDLTGAACALPPRAAAVTLRGMDQHQDLIGSSPRRKEDRRLLVGAGRYLDDMSRQGMLHLGVVRSSHAHARILKVDGREARALPGIVAVWGAGDLPEATRHILAGAEGAHKGRPFAAPVLAREVVRYVGEPVAVVVGDDPYRWPMGSIASSSTTSPCPPWSLLRTR